MLSLEGAGGILQKEEDFLPSSTVLTFWVLPYSYFIADANGDIQCLSAPCACPEHAVPQWDHDARPSLWPLPCVPSDMGTAPAGFYAALPADKFLKPWSFHVSSHQHSAPAKHDFSTAVSYRVLSLSLIFIQCHFSNAELLQITISQGLGSCKVWFFYFIGFFLVPGSCRGQLHAVHSGQQSAACPGISSG